MKDDDLSKMLAFQMPSPLIFNPSRQITHIGDKTDLTVGLTTKGLEDVSKHGETMPRVSEVEKGVDSLPQTNR